MREVVPLLPREEEYPWFRSRLLRRPDISDDDDTDALQEDSTDTAPPSEFTVVQGGVSRPPLSDLETFYSEYQHNRYYTISLTFILFWRSRTEQQWGVLRTFRRNFVFLVKSIIDNYITTLNTQNSENCSLGFYIALSHL
jgi:hypothetical protein